MFGLLQRGGEARTTVILNVKHTTARERLARHIDFSKAKLYTDGHQSCRVIGPDLPHAYVVHEREYVKHDAPDVHTQGID